MPGQDIPITTIIAIKSKKTSANSSFADILKAADATLSMSELLRFKAKSYGDSMV
jgi:hypothetical protein